MREKNQTTAVAHRPLYRSLSTTNVEIQLQKRGGCFCQLKSFAETS